MEARETSHDGDRRKELGFEIKDGLNNQVIDVMFEADNVIATEGAEIVGTVVEDIYMNVIINGKPYQLNLKKI